MDVRFKNGMLEMCLLYKLSKKDYFGYSLIEEMSKIFIDIKDSTYLVILKKLHKAGLTEVCYDDFAEHQKKYYKITEKGKRYLNDSLESWDMMKNIAEKVGII